MSKVCLLFAKKSKLFAFASKKYCFLRDFKRHSEGEYRAETLVKADLLWRNEAINAVFNVMLSFIL